MREFLIDAFLMGSFAGALAGVIGWFFGSSKLMEPTMITVHLKLMHEMYEYKDHFDLVTAVRFASPKTPRAGFVHRLLSCGTCIAWQLLVWIGLPAGAITAVLTADVSLPSLLAATPVAFAAARMVAR